MSIAWKRRARAALRLLLAGAILFFVGRLFVRDLSRLDPASLRLRPGWLVLSALLYLAGLSTSAWFWYRLLYTLGERPALGAALRAYYIGHLGKYIPGKAWALWLRGDLVRGPGVRLGVALLTTFYEVLTTMAAGALVAAAVFVVWPPRLGDFSWHPALTGLALLALCGVPLLPGVFNYLVSSLAARFEHVEGLRVPKVRLATLALGLLATAVGWTLIGLSCWALLHGVLPEAPPLTPALWARLAGSVAFAYVAGFVAVVSPGGLGVREYLLLLLLLPLLLDPMLPPLAARVVVRLAIPEGTAPAAAIIALLPAQTLEPQLVAAVVLLRVVWTAAEVAAAGVLLLFRPRRAERELAEAAGR